MIAHVIQYPTGRYGLVGDVPRDAAYMDKDGQPITDDQAAAVHQVGPKIAGVVGRSYGTAAEAIAALVEAGGVACDSAGCDCEQVIGGSRDELDAPGVRAALTPPEPQTLTRYDLQVIGTTLAGLLEDARGIWGDETGPGARLPHGGPNDRLLVIEYALDTVIELVTELVAELEPAGVSA